MALHYEALSQKGREAVWRNLLQPPGIGRIRSLHVSRGHCRCSHRSLLRKLPHSQTDPSKLARHVLNGRQIKSHFGMKLGFVHVWLCSLLNLMPKGRRARDRERERELQPVLFAVSLFAYSLQAKERERGREREREFSGPKPAAPGPSQQRPALVCSLFLFCAPPNGETTLDISGTHHHRVSRRHRTRTQA